MEPKKETLARFLKRKRRYYQFEQSIRKAYGLSFSEFVDRIQDDDEQMALAVAVLARDAKTRNERRIWQQLEQQWEHYYRVAKGGIKIIEK